MPPRKAAPAAPLVIEVPEAQVGELEVGILGTSPYIHNRLAEKARHELLFPKGRKTTADKAASLKHEPVEEFRSSPYRLHAGAETVLATMGSMFKGAMRTAALDMPGAKSAQIGRLVWVNGHYLPFYGDLFLFMAVTRSADMNKTPDIRTRGISPNWGTVITVGYNSTLITPTSILNLLAAAGKSAGVGDYRPEKGKGTFGQFTICDVDDKRLVALQKKYTAEFQTQALENAEPFDQESGELLGWFEEERKTRGK